MAHIVKEKLKYVKEKLKVWNKEVYGVLDLNIENIVQEMNMMEDEGESEVLWEGNKWKGLNSDFWASLHHKESLLAQKAKVNWIQKGDGNTKFFNNAVKLRQRKNHIEMLQVGEGWITGMEEIKEEVRRYFRCQFKEENVERLSLNGTQFKRISEPNWSRDHSQWEKLGRLFGAVKETRVWARRAQLYIYHVTIFLNCWFSFILMESSQRLSHHHSWL